jgi:hypothetical protein
MPRFEPLRQQLRLFAAALRQWGVELALDAVVTVPGRFAMPYED